MNEYLWQTNYLNKEAKLIDYNVEISKTDTSWINDLVVLEFNGFLWLHILNKLYFVYTCKCIVTHAKLAAIVWYDLMT